jgi:hypothetical protein
VELDGRPLVVRDYYNIFMRLPWVTDGFVGSGFYGVSREGRSRFAAFPEILNDDLFFRSRFSREECLTVHDAQFTIAAPRTVSALVRAKARVHKGTIEFLSLEHERRHQGQSGIPSKYSHVGIVRRIIKQIKYWASSRFWQLARQPSLWRPLLSHSCVRFMAVAVSHKPRFGNREFDWAQDRTTRDGESVKPS